MRELLARLNFMGFEFTPTPAVRVWLMLWLGSLPEQRSITAMQC